MISTCIVTLLQNRSDARTSCGNNCNSQDPSLDTAKEGVERTIPDRHAIFFLVLYCLNIGAMFNSDNLIAERQCVAIL
jgi:hypothetical protein